MKHFFKYFLLLSLFLFSLPDTQAGSAYFNSRLANSLYEADLNDEQQKLIKTEAEAYEKTIAPLYTTNLDEYKKKLNDFFTKLTFGFKVYNLTARNKVLEDSLDSFYGQTNLKVYVISYYDGTFLNRLFQKLAELRYKVQVNKSLLIKIKFKKQDENTDKDQFNYVDTVVASKAVKDTLRKKLKSKEDFENAFASTSGEGMILFSTTSDGDIEKMVNDRLDRLKKFGVKFASNEPGGLATFIDPSGNAISLKVSSGFKIVSAIKDGPILSFEDKNQLYEASLSNGNFSWYQSKSGPYSLDYEQNILPSTLGLWVISRSGNASPYACHIESNYSEETRLFKSYDDSPITYTQVPEQYASKSSSLPESFPGFGVNKPPCTSFSAITIQYKGTIVTEEKIQFAGKEVTKITFNADKLLASATELDKKYESVKKAPAGTKISFHENGFIVSIDEKGTRTSKPISKDDFDKLVKKIESGDITTESEVIYTRDENNSVSIAGLGYNKTLKPSKPGFAFNASQRTDLQTLQKNKLNDYFSKNNVTDLLAKSQARSTNAFPDGAKTEIKSVSYFEVPLQVVRIAGKIIKDFRIPDYFYDSANPEYKDCMIHTSPYFTGVGNGLIEEVLSVPQLVVLGTEVLLDSEMQDSLVAKFKRLTPEKIKNGIVNAGIKLSGTITGTTDRDWHGKGTITVQVATIAYAGAKLLKKSPDEAIPKDAGEALEEIGDATKKLDDLSSKAFRVLNKLKNKLDDLTDAQKELFKKDLDDADFYKFVDDAVDSGPILDSWKVLDEAGFDLLRRKPLELTFIKNNLDKIKAIGGYNLWLNKTLKGGANLFEKVNEISEFIIDINKKYSDGLEFAPGKLGSAINSASYYNKVSEQGVAIFNSIVTTHIFNNGVKRTASDFISNFAKGNGLKLKLDATGLENLTTELAKGVHYNIDQLVEILF